MGADVTKHKIRGEWFNLVPEITKYIAGVKKRQREH